MKRSCEWWERCEADTTTGDRCHHRAVIMWGNRGMCLFHRNRWMRRLG